MLKNLMMHPQTRRQLEGFISKPTQALCLYGPKGAGKRTLALAVASELLHQDLSKGSANLTHVSKAEGKQDIPIEEIRAVRKSLRLTQPGKGPIRRVVFIEDAQHMNHEAQNALLKSLEEPYPGTVFILSLESLAQVLPTVVSRTQQVEVVPVSLAAARKFFSTSKEVDASWQISRGRAGLLSALVDNQEHELRSNITQAKQFILLSRYERALRLIALSKDKAELGAFLEALLLILRPLYRTSAREQKSQAPKLVIASKQVEAARHDLAINVSPRLICLKLALNLSI